MSDRFYCPDPPRGGQLRLAGEEARHLSRVCRLGVGDVVEIFDGRGRATVSEVIAAGHDWVELAVQRDLPERLPPLSLTLASAVPKGERFDWLVEKATELGVERLVPLETARSIVHPGEAKLARLKRSIIEACKQCRRDRLMVLAAPVSWADFAGSCGEALKLLADPAGSLPPLWPALPSGRAVILVVGPEGGFTPQERELAGRTGWHLISLGPNILRVETAGLAGCAALFCRTSQTVH